MKFSKILLFAGLAAIIAFFAPGAEVLALEGGGTPPTSIVGPELWGVIVVDCDSNIATLRVKKIEDCVVEKQAEAALNASGIVVNKNAVPFDEKPPAVASGVRIGTPTVSTRGMQQAEMDQIVSWMDEIIQHSQDAALHKRILREVKNLCARFPIFHPY